MERAPRVLATLQSVSFLVALLGVMVLVGGVLTPPVDERRLELEPGTQAAPIHVPVPGDLAIGSGTSGSAFALGAVPLAFMAGVEATGLSADTAVISEGNGARVAGPGGRNQGGRGNGRQGPHGGGRRGDHGGSSGPGKAPAKSGGGPHKGGNGGSGPSKGGSSGGGPGKGGGGNSGGGGPGKGGGGNSGGGGHGNVGAAHGGGGPGPAKGSGGGKGPGSGGKGNKKGHR